MNERANLFCAAGALAMALLLHGCGDGARRVSGSGSIEAESVRISAQVAGRVASIRVKEGESVTAGQPLAQLDGELLAIQLEQARTGVSLARSQLTLLLKGARSEDLRQAEEQVRRADENHKMAQEDSRRMQALFETRSVTQKQREDAETRLNLAQAELSSAGQALKKLQNLARPEEVDAARIRIEQAGIAARLVEKQLEFTRISAPRRGTLTQIVLKEGEYALPGSVLAVLEDVASLDLLIYVGEPMMGRVRLGQKARITVDAWPGRVFPGTVSWMASRAEFTPRTVQTRDERTTLVFAVKLRLDNPAGELKAGMPADAVLDDD
jgi:HlyD family secretion protein